MSKSVRIMSTMKKSGSLRILFTAKATYVTGAPAPTAETVARNEGVKEFSEMPGQKGLLAFLSFASKVARQHKFQELMSEDFKKFGAKTMRTKLGLWDMVQTCDPTEIRHMMRSTGEYPRRAPMDSWVLWREAANEAQSLITAEGEHWGRLRKAVSKKMLRPQLVLENDKVINEVITDMIARIRHLRDTTGGGAVVPGMTNEAYKWSMESIASILFEKRLGCLKEPTPPESQRFIDAVATTFKYSNYVQTLAKQQQKLNTPMWKTFAAGFNEIFSYARKVIDEKVEQLAKEQNTGEANVSFLNFVISNPNLTRKEAYALMTELLLAGVDTTSNTLCFAIHFLAANPDVQEQLRNEVKSITGSQMLTARDLGHMSYMKAVVKETLRFYPITTGIARMPDRDIVMSGYKVPKGTICFANYYHMGRDEDLFPEADKFKPSRWLRTNGQTLPDPYASQPFGLGVRSCIGRRVAELELYLMLARLVQEFDLKLHGSGKLKVTVVGLLTPGEEIPVQFLDRK